MDGLLVPVVEALLVAAVSIAGTLLFLERSANSRTRVAQRQADQVLQEAEQVRRDAEITAKDEAIRLRGDLDEEWRALHVAHEIAPEHQVVRVRLAKVLTDRGRTEEAIPMYEALLKNGPEYVPLLLGIALAKRDAGAGADLQRAAELFEAGLTVREVAANLRISKSEAGRLRLQAIGDERPHRSSDEKTGYLHQIRR